MRLTFYTACRRSRVTIIHAFAVIFFVSSKFFLPIVSLPFFLSLPSVNETKVEIIFQKYNDKVIIIILLLLTEYDFPLIISIYPFTHLCPFIHTINIVISNIYLFRKRHILFYY